MITKVLSTRIFIVLIFACLSANAHAANFTVNNNGDTSDAAAGNGVCADAAGDCTLRAAVEESNALASDDVINFAASLTNATITLTTGNHITINAVAGALGTLTIVGLGADKLTIDGGAGTNRVFFLNRVTVTVMSRTLQSGGSGGAAIEAVQLV